MSQRARMEGEALLEKVSLMLGDMWILDREEHLHDVLKLLQPARRFIVQLLEEKRELDRVDGKALDRALKAAEIRVDRALKA